MTPTEEYHLRILGAEMIKEAGYSLRLPWYSILTGQNIFHRFFTRVSFLDYDVKEIVMACVFLGAKLEESHRKVRDVVSVCYHVFKVRSGAKKPIPALNLSSNYYHLMRQAVIECERYVLKELGFELYRLSEHPHRYLLSYFRPVRPSSEVIQKAWNYCNDAFLSTICINYPPQVIATSCLYLAIRSTNSPMFKINWWTVFETSIKHILEVSAALLMLYEQPKLNFDNVKEIMDAYFKRNSLKHEYVIDNEAEFELKEKLQMEEEAKKRALEEQNKPKPVSKSDQRRDKGSNSKGRNDKRDKDRRDDRRDDKKRKKRSSRSRERERRRSYSSDSSDSDRRKKKKKRSKRDHSSSSSESRSSSRKKSRKDSSKRSSSRRKDKKRRDSRDRKKDSRRDRSRDRSKDKYANPPKLGRKNSLEMISEQIQENTNKEREKYNQELEKKKKGNNENEEETFLKKGDKKAPAPKPNKSREGLKAAVLATTNQDSSASKNFLNSLKTEEFMKFEENMAEKTEIVEESSNKNGEPIKEQKNGNGKSHEGDEDEMDEERLAELKKKIAENKNKKKRFP